MKNTISELLNEMIQYGKKPFEKKVTNYAYTKMEFSDLSNLIGWLLHWQKEVKLNKTDDDDFFFKTHILLEEVLYNRFKVFFDYCPALNEVFQLESDRIVYNPSLTEMEKQEILDYIDENHTIQITKVRRRPKQN
jgi:hypothetical protein